VTGKILPLQKFFKVVREANHIELKDVVMEVEAGWVDISVNDSVRVEMHNC